MNRKLSPVQQALLVALEHLTHGEPEIDPCQLPATGRLVTEIGRASTPSNRVVVSRALKSLARRGLVDVHYPPIPRPGRGGRYALHVDAEASG